jgi:hypothetical protein
MGDINTGNVDSRVLPLARKDGLVIQELDDETLVYDEERQRAHCLNRVAAAVWKRCDGETTVAEMERLLRHENTIPVQDEAVRLALRQLDKAGLLAEPLANTVDEATVSRREMIKRVGLVAAVCLPLVSSIVAPTPAQAGSRKGTGASCSSSAQCESGVCAGTHCR